MPLQITFLLFQKFSFLSRLDSDAPADPVAPVIVIPPRNITVVSGVSEATLECIANARWVHLYGDKLFHMTTVHLMFIYL